MTGRRRSWCLRPHYSRRRRNYSWRGRRDRIALDARPPLSVKEGIQVRWWCASEAAAVRRVMSLVQAKGPRYRRHKLQKIDRRLVAYRFVKGFWLCRLFQASETLLFHFYPGIRV